MPGDNDPGAGTQYRERAPLVVPKNRAALPPQPKAADRSKSWPKDQEIARREADRARALAPRVDEVHNPVSRTELDRVRSAGVHRRAPTPPATSRWVAPAIRDHSGRRSGTPGRRRTKQRIWCPARKPSRQFLTDPPTGYRKPTTAQKYTFEIKKEDDITDARSQAIQDKRSREDR